MMYTTEKESDFTAFILISLLSHLVLFFALSNYSSGLPSEAYQNVNEVTVHLDIDDEVAARENRKIEIPETVSSTIVSPSDIPESIETPLTNKLSDKTTITKKEQIKRGEVDTQNEMSRPQPAKEKQKVKNIFLDRSSDIFAARSAEDPVENDNSSELAQNEIAADRIQKFIGMSGNSDYLPHVPDGDLTMLNAKADRFAVFVRRVALQVFSSLRTSDWSDHPVFQQNMTTDEVLIQAIMSKEGKLISAQVVKPSSHSSFDRIVLNSVKKGTWDKNPPQAALADDGNIRFIFKSKAWVRQTGSVRSRKWILLGTGLE